MRGDDPSGANWGYLDAFAATVAAHLLIFGWTDTSAPGLAVGGAATALFVYEGAWAKARERARLRQAGPPTRITAAVLEPGDRTGWAVFPDGARAKFTLVSRCPPEISADLIEHRRLWVVGPAREGEVAVALPGRDLFGVVRFAITRSAGAVRGGRWCRRPAPRPPSPGPPPASARVELPPPAPSRSR
ncbi:hypothetical protein Acsp05_08130 [Actinokineospora sp. NBRC 105648]|nr:hypothetical protein Acsp05_08130 [Actinokineospora sp. NBRC 105648]